MIKGKNIMDVIAIFSSRNETLYFSRLLQNSSFYTQIINTPKEAGKACGISVKFSYNILHYAKNIINSKPFRTFVGFFKYNKTLSGVSLERL